MKVKKYLNPSGSLTKRKRRLFYFTPEQEKLFNLVTVPGTNVNSNATDARKTGVQALNFLAQEAARRNTEIEARSDRKTVKRLTTVGERLRGDNGYSSYMSAGTPMSGRDPLLGTIFDWTVGAKGIDALGKTALWNFAKYGPSNLFRGLARNYFINNAFKLELRNPILFGLGKDVTESAYVSSAPKPSDTGLTSLKFFERPTHLSPLELAGVTRGERNFTPRWHVAKYPGYLLKGLMEGSPLEKQLSKNGTININLLNAYFNKASQIEREVANKVLAEKFAGQKTIDYNLFKKAVLNELIGNYNRVPLTEWADYGMEGLGFETQITHDGNAVAYNEVTGEFEQVAPFTPFKPNYTLNTFTFESPFIPNGNTKHYGGKPIGHSRTYTLLEEPNTLHVMESQSDWAQKSLGLTKAEKTAIQNIDEQLKTGTPTGFSTLEELQVQKQAILDRASQRTLGISYLSLHLHDNYLQRQLQENLRYAAENGLTKMRYPTSETAAKIEGYKKLIAPRPTRKQEIELRDLLDKMWKEYYDANESQLSNASLLELELIGRKNIPNFAKITDELELLRNIPDKYEYIPEHQTILKKYADFPKLFLKLYKGLLVRTVTDAKGNTWYEVDVPKGYLSKEWLFKQGGKITINNTLI